MAPAAWPLRTVFISDVHLGSAHCHAAELAVSAALSEERGTLEDVVEPFLIQQGFLVRTARGRMATQKAWRHLGLKPRNPPADLFAGEGIDVD